MRLLQFVFAGALLAPGLPAAKPPAAPPAPAPSPLAAEKGPILGHLNALVGWYRDVQGGTKFVIEPSEAFFLNTDRDQAERAVRAGFAAAVAEVPLVAEATSTSAAGSAQGQRVASLLVTAQDRVAKLQSQKAELDAQARGGDAPASVTGQRDLVAAQLQLAQARYDGIQKMSAFLNGSGDEAAVTSLAGQIRALQRSVPELFNSDGAPATPVAAPATVPAPAVSGGLVGRAEALYSLMRSRSGLDRLIRETDALSAAANKLRLPLRTALVSVMQQSEQLANQADASSDPQQLASMRQQIESWTSQYKALSAVFVPYTQEITLLSQASDNLKEWHASLDRQYSALLQALAIKVLVLGAALILLLFVSEVWRRATFRYVHDARRRRQFLLIRRFVTGGLVTIVLIMGVVSDLGSLATFAGFITAGIAVALQSVILSVAAYFFLIGRYGVKVGDRVTLSGVTGDVIDIGLVRVYLMELAGTGVDLHPTGRVVVFANSALFSATTPLYKQIPGTDFTWHELYVEVKPDGDVAHVRDTLLAAVNAVYGEYRPGLEEQHSSVERLIDVRMEVPVPVASVRLADAGVEVVVRYPVMIRQGSETDSRVTQGVLTALHADPKASASAVGMPKLRAAVKV